MAATEVRQATAVATADDGPGTTTPLGRREVALLVVLLLVGLAVRLPAIGEAPLAFHPTRQYRSALFARYLAAQVRPDASPVSAEVAEASQSGTYEPPIMETIAAASFVASGQEPLWVVRLVAAACWMGVALITYLLARRLAGIAAAAVAASVVVFLPFTVPASRSFQPEPLMVLAMMAALLALIRHDEDPTRRRLLVAAGLAAAAVFVKPMCVFVLAAAFAAVTLRRVGWRRAVSADSATYLAVMVAPGAVWVAWAMFGTGAIAHVPAESPSLALLTSGAYWSGWWHQLGKVVGLPVLAAAAVGLVVAPARLRTLVLGALAGYVAYGLYFAFQIHTHDYYSLLVVPLVALAAGGFGGWAHERARAVGLELAVVGLAAVALVAAVGLDLERAARIPDQRLITQAVEIGEATDHTTHALILAPAYGQHLRYHGGFSAEPWPYPYDDRRDVLQGEQPRSGGEHLDEVAAEEGAELFIVADLDELAANDSLRRVLEAEHPVLARGQDWIVYDLR